MSMTRLVTELRRHGIQPTAQRIAVASFVLSSADHPTAEQVWSRVRKGFPTLSRATVYNTLNLFVEKGLLKAQAIRERAVIFEPRSERHHHFVDLDTGTIHDVPWEALRVNGTRSLGGFEVIDYQVVMRGRRRR
jgi:Fur family iron response transcriptional regulator